MAMFWQILLFFGFSYISAQTPLVFELTFKGQSLILEKSYFAENLQDSVRIDNCKFYISNLRFINEGKVISKVSNSYHLIDATDKSTLNIPLIYPQNTIFDHLQFEIGIDSTTNAKGVFSGDLDPMHNMYWTWQSGYINVKIEGFTKSATTRDHSFQFHLGGYKAPFNSLQTLNIPLSSNHQKPTIKVDVGDFITNIDLSTLAMVMSPSIKSVLLSKQFSTHFIYRNAF